MAALDDEDKRIWFRREILPLEAELRAYAQRFSRTGAEPEDLVSETFARAIAHEAWRTVDNPAAFTRRILKNLALDAVRRSKIVSIQSVADLDVLGLVDEDPDPEAVALSRDELRRLSLIVEDLSPQVRRVFTLKKVYEMSTAAIAGELGITVSTVEKHLTRALRICSDRLARDRDGKHKPGRPWDKTRDSGETW